MNPTTYEAIDRAAGWFDRSARLRLEIKGPDRAKFLHNLTTNDVKRLAEGSGQETFVTSPQGKTLAYATLLATPSAILLRTEPESRDGLMPHLAKYGVFDDVAIDDVSASTFEVHLAGAGLDAILGDLHLAPRPGTPLGHREATVESTPILLVDESPTGRPGLTLIGPADGLSTIRARLARAGVAEGDAETFEALRIEAGTPLSGRDVLANNLPQEVGRDRQAINFVKGCYLGQETVARLDALGHVNRILKGLRLEGAALPPAGSSLLAEGKAVGTITSAADSPGGGDAIALGYVRVAQATAGTRVSVAIEGAGEIPAEVVDLPMGPGPGK